MVELSERVQPGQMLVTMKDPFANARVATAESAVAGATEANQNVHRGGTQEELIGLHGDLQHAREAQTAAQRSVQVLEELKRQGAAGGGELAAARRRLDDANTTLATLQQRERERFSRAAVHATAARLADAKAALDSARLQYDDAHLASPVAGTVYSVAVSPYDFVPKGAELLRVADLRAFFDEPEVGKLKAGQSVTIVWDGRPGLTWHGHIREAPVAAQRQGDRSVAECLIRVDDANGALLPNTHVIVSVPIEQHAHVLTVPRPALDIDGQDQSVFRVISSSCLAEAVSSASTSAHRRASASAR